MADVLIEIENVRCFRERTLVPLAPLTLLVGENSTGKSTVLAAIRLAADIANRRIPSDFNEDPFLLGSFESIASARNEGHSTEHFSLGIEKSIHPDLVGLTQRTTGQVLCRGVFRKHAAQPRISSWLVEADPFRLEILFRDGDEIETVRVSTPSGEFSSQPKEKIAFLYWSDLSLTVLSRLVHDGELRSKRKLPSKEELGNIFLLATLCTNPTRPLAIAPVRARPQRTYDRTTDTPSAQGEHAPMLLANGVSGDNSRRLKSAINSFGRASGLFKRVVVKPLGRSEAAPFQIQIDFGGPNINLIDTGYGISQVLPILVEALRSEKGSRLLIQQPEVHLHPRAQAELGSLLLHLANAEDKSFVVETHSDHLLGRVMSEVRESGIDPAKVRILYFERQDAYRVQIHPLTLDEQGNILDAPPTYRHFFLEEERRLLGV